MKYKYINIKINDTDKYQTKRFVATLWSADKNKIKTIPFGAREGQTYIDHGDKIKRFNYINRHIVNENWDKINAGSLSRYILWENENIIQNINFYLRKFNLIYLPNS